MTCVRRQTVFLWNFKGHAVYMTSTTCLICNSYLEVSNPKKNKIEGINSEIIKTQWIYSNCILDTILDLKDLGWYQGYK